MHAACRRRSEALACHRQSVKLAFTDFLFAGALDGPRYNGADALTAYRDGLAVIREAAAPGTFLIGCGAPVLASAGAGLDAVRTSPDVSAVFEAPGGDLTQPAGRSAIETGRARAYLHGRALRADLDCIIARLGAEHREELAAHIASLPGSLRVSGDPLPELDDWGIRATRQLLRQGQGEHGSLQPEHPAQAAFRTTS